MLIKRGLLLVSLSLLVSMCLAQVEKMVLVEEFTSASCQSCAVQNPILDALLQQNADRVITVKYHVGWPGKDPNYPCNSQDAESRVKFYGVSGAPFALLNGSPLTGPHYLGAPVNLTQSVVNQAILRNSGLRLQLDHTCSPGKDTLWVKLWIKAEASLKIPLYAYIAVEEKQVDFPCAPGTNGEKRFTHVVKKMLPGPEGTLLKGLTQPGDSVQITTYWLLDHVFNPEQLCVAAWVQDPSSREVYQAAFSKPKGPDALNISPVEILKPDYTLCGNVITPEIVVQNRGGIPVNQFSIYYQVNGGAPLSYSWNGNLLFLEKTSISLPSIKFTPAQKSNLLTIITSNPNNAEDSTPQDDTLELFFDTAPVLGPQLNLELKTDQYPAETTWKLFNSSGVAIEYGGPYSGVNTLYTHSFQLTSADCYEFVIYDQFGDGINGNFGQGYYKLKDHNNQVVHHGSAFNNRESISFKVDLSLSPRAPELIPDFQVFPNPFDNTATITLYLPVDQNVTLRVMNEVGQTVYFLDKIAFTAGNHTLDLNGETWTPGIYFVKLLTGDTLLTKKLSLTK